MANNYFQFKQFQIIQEDCAMKVCTDSCLFGAWVAEKIASSAIKCQNIADLGAGTGLLSLMIAQRHDTKITGVELDRTAAKVAAENAAKSPYSQRIKIIAADILEFNPSQKFDFIVSNPPFYEGDLTSDQFTINAARHDYGLKIEELARRMKFLITDEGEVALLAPYKREIRFIEAMQAEGFYPSEICRVKHSEKKAFIRTMFIFSFRKMQCKDAMIMIRNKENNYSAEFTKLLAPYYLAL